MTICGECVCPAPIPTAPIGDLCTVYNDTHALCSTGGFMASNMTWGNAFAAGVEFTAIAVVIILAANYLFNNKTSDGAK